MAFTASQRSILVRRIERAILWRSIERSNAESWRTTQAHDMAITVANELEVSEVQAATQRRAVQRVITQIEKAV